MARFTFARMGRSSTSPGACDAPEQSRKRNDLACSYLEIDVTKKPWRREVAYPQHPPCLKHAAEVFVDAAPIIIFTTASCVASTRASVPTYCPSRKTLTRSHKQNNSYILCET